MVPGSEQRLAQTDGYEPQRSNVLRMLGYYSLLGLLRVHCLVGDYHGALKALAPMNPFKRKNLLTPRIAGAPAFYHFGACKKQRCHLGVPLIGSLDSWTFHGEAAEVSRSKRLPLVVCLV